MLGPRLGTLESGIDVGQGINVGPGKLDKKEPEIPKLMINKTSN